MHRNATFLAWHHDGLVASEIAKAEARKGVVTARRKPVSKANIKTLTSLRKLGVIV